MIHVASILHGEVVNVSTPDIQMSETDVFGNKVSVGRFGLSPIPAHSPPQLQYSVLTGDFLLSKAIVALARLQNVHVVALMSRAVADFIEGKSRVLNQAPGGHEVSSGPDTASPSLYVYIFTYMHI